MKAVFFLQTDPFLPKPALRALREADALSRAGWEVAFVAWIKAAEVPPAAAPDSYPVRRVPVPVPPLGTSFIGRALAYNRATNALFHAGVEEKPDLIVGHDLEVLWAAAMTKRYTRRPLIYDSHEDWPALIAENSALESRIAKVQEQRLCRRVSHVVTVSEPIADKFRKMKKPTTVLYNARPSSEIHPADRESSRKAFGYGPDDFVVGFAGALGKGRGLDVLLESLAHLPPSVKTLIVGGPDEEAAVLRQRAEALGVSGRARVDGYRPFRELAPYYAAMDVGVVLLEPWPNHLRALPNKLFDYMAHGVAVIVPDYPAMAPIVRKGPCGWTVPEVRWPSVSYAIQEARASAETGTRGKTGRDTYLREYAWERQAKDFLRIVRTLTEGRDA
ncbi:MAG: glycosyltransferase family 4 protein [Thermoplasmata archaeon]